MYTRKELLKKINELELNDKSLIWYSKKDQKFIPCTLRRLQDLQNKKLLQSIRYNGVSTIYDQSSIDRYIEITNFRKDGFKLCQLKTYLNNSNISEIEIDKFKDKKLSNSDKNEILNLIDKLTNILRDNI